MKEQPTKVGMISLGCPKNLVDSEVMLGLLKKDGFQITNQEDEAEVMVVNTCAFIDPSKKESVDTILEIAKLKETGRLKKLIVSGCLAQRYKKDLEKEFPQVDHFLGTGEFQNVAELARIEDKQNAPRSIISRPEYVYDAETPRISSLPPHTAYLKIAEGCSRTCSFCIIPRLRGRGRSRSIASIVQEARQLADQGTKEISLVAQDLTSYGRDREDGATLEKLLEELIEVSKIEWIRLMYNYPMYFSDRLIDLIAHSGKVCRYLDMPLQHIDENLLSSMNRKVNEKETRALLMKLREKIPGLHLRTTLIVGFPGETEDHFQKLKSFVRDTEFDALGVFPYYREEGTVAATLPNQIDEKLKDERHKEIMLLQQGISKKRNSMQIGKSLRVLVDQKLPQGGDFGFVGRTEGQAVDIDGSVMLRGKGIQTGDFVQAEIIDAAEYDLFGQVGPLRRALPTQQHH